MRFCLQKYRHGTARNAKPRSASGGGGNGGFLRKSEGYVKRLVYLLHGSIVKMAHFVLKPPFIDGSYLLQQHNGILGQPSVGFYRDMGGKPCLSGLACDSGGNYGGALFVAHVILNDQHRTYPALLASYHR